MSRISRFPALAALLTGTAAAAAPATVTAEDGAEGTTLNMGQLEAAMAKDVDKATADATAAANTRWNAVITSDAGKQNPAAAARMLTGSTMSADDIVATLGDLAPAAPAAPAGKAAGTAGTDAKRLASASEETAVDTGGALGGGTRTQGGVDAKAHRAKIAEERNKRATSAAGGSANVKTANLATA